MSTNHGAVVSHPLHADAADAVTSAPRSTVTPSPSGVDALDGIAVREREALPANAVVIVADGHTATPDPSAGAWGLQVIAADTAVVGGSLVLFAALPLTSQPDAHRYDGDIVVRLRTDATTPADNRAFVDVDVLIARAGQWERAATWSGMDAQWPHRIAPTVIRLMACDARPAIEPPAPAGANGRFGALRELVSAGSLRDGEKLVCARPGTGVRYEAHVVDGGLQLPDGRWFARPSGALTALGYRNQNGWYYWCRARDGVPLSEFRQAPLPRTPYQREPHLLAMVSDGILNAGDELRFVQPRKGIVRKAQVLSDGRLRLDDGSCHATPSATIAAASNGTVTEGWRTWHRASDNRTLADLRDEHRRRVAASHAQQPPVHYTADGSGHELPSTPSTT